VEIWATRWKTTEFLKIRKEDLTLVYIEDKIFGSDLNPNKEKVMLLKLENCFQNDEDFAYENYFHDMFLHYDDDEDKFVFRSLAITPTSNVSLFTESFIEDMLENWNLTIQEKFLIENCQIEVKEYAMNKAEQLTNRHYYWELAWDITEEEVENIRETYFELLEEDEEFLDLKELVSEIKKYFNIDIKAEIDNILTLATEN
jgi:hypothetical protein